MRCSRGLYQWQYKHRFDKLVQYVRHYDSDEEEKAARFIWGLRPEISRSLVTLGLTSYHEAVQKASLVEREDLRARPAPSHPQTSGKSSASQGSSQRSDRSSRFCRSGRFGRTNRGGRSTRDRETIKTYPLCRFCKKNHPRECYYRSGRCYNCGSEDHWVRDCPKLDKMDSTVQDRP